LDRGNVFDGIPDVPGEELTERLLAGKRVTIERIVSAGHASAEGFWYDQETNEWVILLSGGAGLRFEDESELLVLRPGDYVEIPAHRRHRVEWTDPDVPSVWLAVFY
jgi:cupin 2 domain-containing protein